MRATFSPKPRFNRLFFLLVAMCSAACSANPLDDVKTIEEATYFSVGATGIGGLISPAQESMTRLASAANRDAALNDIRKNGSIAARIYLACYWSTFDKKQFEQISTELQSKEADTLVDTMKGSLLSRRKVSDVLAGMKAGDCGTLLLAPGK